MKPSITIIGCGKVGNALGLFLHAAGYPIVGLSGSDIQTARRLSEATSGCPCDAEAWTASAKAQVVFITTPDGTIADVCRSIAGQNGFAAGAAVLHCSGALPSTILAPARTCGAEIGSLHPLQSFASTIYRENPFDGIVTTTEGDLRAVAVARGISEDLGATCYTLHTDGKLLYHASAVVASNCLVTLMDLALRMMARAGIEENRTFDVLKPLVQGTLANIAKLGTVQALTGPISRGDSATLAAHLQTLADKMPADLDLFKTLSRYTLTIAEAQGGLSDSARGELEKLLHSQ